MEKCKHSSEPIIIHKGYWVWWCEKHKQPAPWCDKDRAVEKALEDQKKKIVRAMTPYCCHVTGMHDPTHFKNNPEEICGLQKENAYDRLCNHLKLNPKAMVNPKGCYNCQTEEERMEDKG